MLNYLGIFIFGTIEHLPNIALLTQYKMSEFITVASYHQFIVPLLYSIYHIHLPSFKRNPSCRTRHRSQCTKNVMMKLPYVKEKGLSPFNSSHYLDNVLAIWRSAPSGIAGDKTAPILYVPATIKVVLGHYLCLVECTQHSTAIIT